MSVLLNTEVWYSSQAAVEQAYQDTFAAVINGTFASSLTSLLPASSELGGDSGVRHNSARPAKFVARWLSELCPAVQAETGSVAVTSVTQCASCQGEQQMPVLHSLTLVMGWSNHPGPPACLPAVPTAKPSTPALSNTTDASRTGAFIYVAPAAGATSYTIRCPQLEDPSTQIKSLVTSSVVTFRVTSLRPNTTYA